MLFTTAPSLLFLSVVSAAPLFGSVSKVSYGPGNNWFSPPSGQGAPQSNGYQCFHGDITNYPALNKWVSFDNMWQINRATILSFNPIERARDIYYSIKSISTESNVDPRIILAVMMQEASNTKRKVSEKIY